MNHKKTFSKEVTVLRNELRRMIDKINIESKKEVGHHKRHSFLIVECYACESYLKLKRDNCICLSALSMTGEQIKICQDGCFMCAFSEIKFVRG